MKCGLVPLFSRRMLKGIRKEKHQYYSVRIGYGRNGELPYLLNETGLDIIKLCDGRHDVLDIVDEMSKLYKNISKDRLQSDVEVYLKHLTEYSAVLWIGKTWIPHSPWVEQINGDVLAVCEPECGFLASLFCKRIGNVHILLSSDREGHSFDPILCGGSVGSSLMFALLDSDYAIRVIVSFSVVGYGGDLYLNFDRIDLRVNSDIICLNSVFRGSIRIMNAMFGERPKPSRIRVWVRESLPQKQFFIENLKDMGFAEEVTLETGLIDKFVTAYEQSWNKMLCKI